MKLVCISDTHGQHARLVVPAGDVLVHAGDWSGAGEEAKPHDFLGWLDAQPHAHKIFIAGNHDFYPERHPDHFREQIAATSRVAYLDDSGTIIEGVHFWGSPVTPWFYDWAFNRSRGAEIARHWSRIPNDTHVLVTHGPPQGVLDADGNGEGQGCWDLLQRTAELSQLRLHVFGHMHAWGGRVLRDGAKRFLNASVCDDKNRLVREPLVIEI